MAPCTKSPTTALKQRCSTSGNPLTGARQTVSPLIPGVAVLNPTLATFVSLYPPEPQPSPAGSRPQQPWLALGGPAGPGWASTCARDWQANRTHRKQVETHILEEGHGKALPRYILYYYILNFTDLLSCPCPNSVEETLPHLQPPSLELGRSRGGSRPILPSSSPPSLCAPRGDCKGGRGRGDPASTAPPPLRASEVPPPGEMADGPSSGPDYAFSSASQILQGSFL